MEDASIYYEKCIFYNNKNMNIVKKRLTHMYIYRLASFICFASFMCTYIHYNYLLLLVIAIFFLITFLGLIKYDLNLDKRYNILKLRTDVYQEELDIINNNYSYRNTGVVYSELNKHLIADFDIVGEGSLFQFINRTRTIKGEKKLAQALCNPICTNERIEEHQKAIHELSTKIKFINNFLTYGKTFTEVESEYNYLESWINSTDKERTKAKFLCILSPCLTAIWICAIFLGLLDSGTLILLMVSNLLIVNLNNKKIELAHEKLGRMAKIVKKYYYLICLIENETFSSKLLNEIKSCLISEDNISSKKIKQLFKILDMFDSRHNMLISYVLNSFIAFNLQVFYILNKWKIKNGANIMPWFDSLAEIDYLISFAIFEYNNAKDVIYPKISTEKFELSTKEIGHPLINSDNRITNDIVINKTPAIIIITGANMAGKSTFLRTIATNLILALNGSPVCAKEFIFSPCSIMSSIKIQDSLARNESYFYAEISRLNEIVSFVKKEKKTIVILDEILRGTNSKDKQIGSLGLLKKLIYENAIVIIATHDLAIGELEQDFPEIATNYCFEVELRNDILNFDYKLKKGISTKLNASFLLRKMELID